MPSPETDAGHVKSSPGPRSKTGLVGPGHLSTWVSSPPVEESYAGEPKLGSSVCVCVRACVRPSVTCVRRRSKILTVTTSSSTGVRS
eukprot:220318-Rhodomonas_salina.1